MCSNHLRCGVRVAAGVIGLVCFGYGCYSVKLGDPQFAEVMEGLTFILLLAIGWVVVEAVIGGFEQLQRASQTRYELLAAAQPNACAVAAQTVVEMERKRLLALEQDAADGAGGKVTHLYS